VPDGLLSAEFPPMMLQSAGRKRDQARPGAREPEGGSLTVNAEVAHGKLAVTVADTGLGFGVAATAGTGVGPGQHPRAPGRCCTARRRWRPDRGENPPVAAPSVSITAPTWSAAEAAAEAPPARLRTAPWTTAPAPAPRAVLIADDERLMREQLRARLAAGVARAGDRGRGASNGLEAVGAGRAEHRPEIVSPGTSACPALTARGGGAAARPSCRRARWRGRRLSRGREIVLHHRPTTSTRSRPSSRAWRTMCSSRPSASVCWLRWQRIRKRLAAEAAPSAAGRGRPAAAAATRCAGQQLCKAWRSAQPGASPSVQWIQATVCQAIQMIPVEDVLFFISDEKYTRVQTATCRGA